MVHQKDNTQRQFDIIIVGGGTSGCVMAARLSENSNRRVLLIESGKDDEHYSSAIRHPEKSYGNLLLNAWTRRKLVRLRNNFIPTLMLRGNILGGTSAVNFMAAIRGQPEDYQEWLELGCEGWGWKDVLPSFKRAETDIDFPESELHGSSGPMRLQRWNETTFSGVHKALLNGAQACGASKTDDLNNRTTLPGVGSFPGTVQDSGERLTVSQAYLTAQVRKRTNLSIITQETIAKILMDKNTAIGVSTVEGNSYYGAEVIICAGAFESPKILKLSGIGPKEELSKKGIQTTCDLPMVGENLQDHLGVGFLYRGPYERLVGSSAQVLWAGSTEDSNDINFHIFAMPMISLPILGTIVLAFAFHLTPRTRGRVLLKNTKPKTFPKLDLNFLSDIDDLHDMHNIVKKLYQWERSDAFKEWGGRRIFPFGSIKKMWQLKIAKSLSTYSYFHHVGTCRMGNSEKNSVVDFQCRVHGVNNLRVVDASVMPKIIRGNTYLCCVMMAERLSEIMNKDICKR